MSLALLCCTTRTQLLRGKGWRACQYEPIGNRGATGERTSNEHNNKKTQKCYIAFALHTIMHRFHHSDTHTRCSSSARDAQSSLLFSHTLDPLIYTLTHTRAVAHPPKQYRCRALNFFLYRAVAWLSFFSLFLPTLPHHLHHR